MTDKIFVGKEGNRSDSDIGTYVKVVTEAVENYESFCNFKKDPRYTEVLEHVTPEYGLKYLNVIKQQTPDFLNLINEFKENDHVGGASPYYYDDIETEISPSTLRYVKVASDLRVLFGKNIGRRIAEIGVGYGGQMLMIDKVFDFDRYDLFDLPPVLELTSKYLESHMLNNSYRTCTLNQSQGDVEYDLIVSNYAFSELPSQVQLRYIDKILSKSTRGYLTMNSGAPGREQFDVNKLPAVYIQQLIPNAQIFAEEPNAGEGNYIIAWGHNG